MNRVPKKASIWSGKSKVSFLSPTKSAEWRVICIYMCTCKCKWSEIDNKSQDISVWWKGVGNLHADVNKFECNSNHSTSCLFFLKFHSENCCKLNKVTQHALKPHNLIFLVIFCSFIVSKTVKMFHQFPPTNNRGHLIYRKICIHYWHESIGPIP